MRHKYTSDDFCKKHSKSLKISGNQYCGLATFYHYNVKEVNLHLPEHDHVQVLGTPIDENGNYVQLLTVFVNAKGLPMHADMVYNKPITKGEVSTSYRMYASKLLQLAKYYSDPYPDSDYWQGNQLAS